MNDSRNKISIPIVEPVSFGLITTDKCTAACKDCCFGCRQDNDKTMCLQMMTDIVSQASESFPKVKVIVLTGGECFLLGEDLYSIVCHINSHGLASRIVTNAFWASSFKKAYNILKRLKECGLTEINVSTGDEHLKWVPYDNIVNVIVASIKNDIPLTINIESSGSKTFKKSLLIEDIRLKKYQESYDSVRIVNGSWISFDNENGEKEQKQTIALGTNLRRCSSLFMTPSINPDGKVVSCCGLTSQRHPHLEMGDLTQSSLREIVETSFEDFLKIWIYTEGPFSILDYCSKFNNTLPEISRDKHICEYCHTIYTNNEVFNTIKSHYKKIVANVISKYIILNSKHPSS